ncbi:MAG: transposase family protein [Flavobacteriales bacterium]|nr:transposase family protein [Flavobacteriales bacterium]
MVAVIDVHTRYLLNWSISNTMEAEWVTGMISEAIAMHGKPEIINSDQGCQFTSEAYTALFRKGGVAEGVLISMDGKGRDRQRLHRTLLAHAQARSPVPGSAHGWYRTLPELRPLHRTLQQQAQALLARLPHTSSMLPRGSLRYQQNNE